MTNRSTAPSWATFGQAIHLVISGRTVRTALPVAAIVGTILSAINEGSVVASAHLSVSTWVRIGLNFVVPYLVASAGYLAPFRRTDRYFPPEREKF